MTASYPVYTRLLPLLSNASVIDFPDPLPRESLTNYAVRMAERFPQRCVIGGTSFGGIIAQEVARVLRPAGCVVIASVTKPSHLPPWIRLGRLVGEENCSRVLDTIGSSAALVPKSIRTGSTRRFTKLSGRSGRWHRWATSAMLGWRSASGSHPSPLLHIHGDADTTFPARYAKPDVVIPGGRHMLPISHPIEVANAIASFMASLGESGS